MTSHPERLVNRASRSGPRKSPTTGFSETWTFPLSAFPSRLWATQETKAVCLLQRGDLWGGEAKINVCWIPSVWQIYHPGSIHIYFLEVCVCVCVCMLSCLVVSDTLRPPGLKPAKLLCPWDFPARILEWVAISSSRGSSRPRDWTPISCVSCIGRQILHYCITREAHSLASPQRLFIYLYLFIWMHLALVAVHRTFAESCWIFCSGALTL